ncbi:hypothetical protein J7E87_33910 [Streptomyces sp. ISL-1]|uniref:hypothetical protein n=1 Tax=Streptomyces sp. ISL-1 TaxID=2817657 RepID=UPI001BE8B7AB|nr:hypothetical protein [Streptomyces sp. ISL-1]MBT2394267.1 hypothetical protein [Streptomyces sp. ISL-1]
MRNRGGRRFPRAGGVLVGPHRGRVRSSWINQVERWFGFLADQMIRRGTHKNVQVLEADIRAWVKNWNEDPKPFIWTKTAEEILDSLARFCRRISGAGH